MKKFAVFDIDGTLIRWQLYHSLIDKLAKKGLLGDNVLDQIKAARMRWKRRESNQGFHEYERVLVGIFEAALPHISPQEVDKATDEVIEQYKDQIYTYTRDLIARLKKGGYLLFAISGSQEELVKKLAQHYGFDDWLGTQYIRENNSFTGSKYFPAADKGVALKQLVEKYQATYKGSWAVGDSKSDANMMKLVEHPVAFNPDQQLFEIAKENKWSIIIERKNVIYQLRNESGSYKLI